MMKPSMMKLSSKAHDIVNTPNVRTSSKSGKAPHFNSVEDVLDWLTGMVEVHEDVNTPRAIPAHHALSGFGRMLRGSSGGYEHSRQVSQINEFWSHSWSAPVWSKVCALLLFYNGVPSIIAGLVAAMIAALLSVMVLTSPAISSLVALAVGSFAALAFFALRKPQGGIFLDKACICQDDDERKEAAIRNLDFYIENSKTTLLIWDESYLTRLWCVFELATLLKFSVADGGRETGKVTPLLLSQAVTTVRAAGVHFAVLLLGSLVVRAQMPGSATALLAHAFTASLALCAVTLLLRGQVRSLACQQEQVATFSISKAQCFCCNHGHKHPETNAPLPCDRELVEARVAESFSSCSNFDQLARRELGKYLKQSSRLPFSHAFFIMMPALWVAIGECAWHVSQGCSVQGLRIFALGSMYAAIAGPWILNFLHSRL